MPGNTADSALNRGTTTVVCALYNITCRIYLVLEVCVFLQNHVGAILDNKKKWGGGITRVCGTRSSMLAGLSCTKGVWYIYDWDTGSTILIW